MRVTVTELKNRFSRYLRLVKQGEVIEVVEHSVPIARLERLEPGSARDERLDKLVKDGVVSRAKRWDAAKLLSKPPVPCRGDAVRALVEGRGER